MSIETSGSGYYLCGLESPHAYLLLNGRNRTTTLYLPHRDPARERGEGKMLSAEDADLVKTLTGVDEVAGLLRSAEAAGVDCVGLMAIAPLVETAEQNRRWFVALRELRDNLLDDFPHLEHLSMGMTDDFEVAIEEGATLIRVGRAIFGSPGQPGME